MFVRKIIVAFLFMAPLEALAFDEVHRCDEVAAHPQDPGRWAAGMTDGDLVPAPAMSFCTAAVQAHPDVARFQFQLARAYWAAGRHGDAMPILYALADENHAGAMVYLAMAHEAGLGGVRPDPDLAGRFRGLAEAGGFVVVSGPNRSTAAAAELEFNPTIYNQPSMIRSLHDGRLDALRVAGIGDIVEFSGVKKEFVYLAGLHASFANPVSRIMDRQCVLMHKPAVGERLVSMAMDQSGVMNDPNVALGKLAKLVTDGIRNPQALVQQEMNTKLLRQMGEQDGERLLVAHGCASDVTRRIYANLEAYVTGTRPVTGAGSASGETTPAGVASPESDSAAALRTRWAERDRQRLLDAARDAASRGN